MNESGFEEDFIVVLHVLLSSCFVFTFLAMPPFPILFRLNFELEGTIQQAHLNKFKAQ